MSSTPHVALWLQALIAIALIAINLDQLIDYTSSAMLITGTLTVLSVIVLRRKQPDTPRPYTVTLGPRRRRVVRRRPRAVARRHQAPATGAHIGRTASLVERTQRPRMRVC